MKTLEKRKIVCEYSKKCGGCSYINKGNKEQLDIKQGYIEKLLSVYGKVNNIIGMENPYNYRNKVHAAFGRNKNGEIISGIYEENSHRIININKCKIENEKSDEIINDIKKLLKSFKIKIYDEDTGYGLFRHILIRNAHKTGQIMVVLVLSSVVMPSKNNFVKALRKMHPEITTIILNVNDKKTSMVLGDRNVVLYGKGYIEDILCGIKYRISPNSFYQINSLQTEKMYKKAIDLAGLTGKEKVIDAYSGIGTIGMTASSTAKEVICVELNKFAVQDSIRNAKENGIKNVRFVCDDAGKFMLKMSDANEKADVVFMDPPRAGSTKTFITSVAKLSPKRVVYISCNPETLERDLKVFNKFGYKMEEACPYDMFPFTDSIETVVLLSKKEVSIY